MTGYHLVVAVAYVAAAWTLRKNYIGVEFRSGRHIPLSGALFAGITAVNGAYLIQQVTQ